MPFMASSCLAGFWSWPDAATPLAQVLGFVAVVFGSANVFGGFMVTDRMLQMFKKKKQP